MEDSSGDESYEGLVWSTPGVVDRMETTVRSKSLAVVDRVEPIFQEHAASMADREASVLYVERVVLLELENEVGHDEVGSKRIKVFKRRDKSEIQFKALDNSILSIDIQEE
jgi:aminoglycoside N3'-acetyltransferase